MLKICQHLGGAWQPNPERWRNGWISRLLRRSLGWGLMALAVWPPVEAGRAESTLPEPIRNVGIDQRLDEMLPLDTEFRDESGQLVHLRDYFGEKPVILSLVYYECPMLCNEITNGLVSSLRALSFSIGQEFQVVTVSFDAREDSELARSVKTSYLKRYSRPSAEKGWHFLTGDQTSIDRLTKAVGFRYNYDAQKNQFAHASGIMVVTPEGRLSRYFYGVEFAPRDLRLALVEAAQNRIGSLADQVLLFCFHYDPVQGKYGFAIMSAIRIVGTLFIITLGVSLWLLLRRERAAGSGLRGSEAYR
ncbi:MAG: SCO family protein [Acidobacteriota bacterium]